MQDLVSGSCTQLGWLCVKYSLEVVTKYHVVTAHENIVIAQGNVATTQNNVVMAPLGQNMVSSPLTVSSSLQW